MKKSVHFSSERDDWETPQWLFDKLNTEFNFDVDVCADAYNCKVANYFDREADGLRQNWCQFKAPWMNPPFGRQIRSWVRKAYVTGKLGTPVVALLPARTDTQWFHTYIYKPKAEIRFLEGRVNFDEQSLLDEGGAPFPTMIVIFRWT